MASALQQQAQKLLDESKEIRGIEGRSTITGDFLVEGARTRKWFNDIKLFASRLPDNYGLKGEIEKAYSHRGMASTFSKMVSYLESIVTDDFLESQSFPIRQLDGSSGNKEYDVFISHANKDKNAYVDELYKTFSQLGIRIFYDKEEISWGDNWKERILHGTAQSEFAVIVISQNFFGREWTERELREFLQRQNSSHQKIVLPLLYNITRKDLLAQYPFLEEIQYISNEDYSVEEICILFAKELIKRLRN